MLTKDKISMAEEKQDEKKEEQIIEQKKVVKQRKCWFKVLKKIMKIRYKKPTFVYLGEKFTNGGNYSL